MKRTEKQLQQESVPVGCVPSAAVAAGGMCVSQHALGGGEGVCIPACTGQRGVWRGVGGGGVSATPSVNRITNTCENITLPQLRWGR